MIRVSSSHWATQVPDHLVQLHNVGIPCDLYLLVSVFILAELEPRHENVLDIFKPIQRPQTLLLLVIGGC